MNSRWAQFFLYWASTALALWVVDAVFDSLEFDTPATLVLSAFVLALVNLTLKPLLLLVTLPLTVLTLGLAIPLINGLVLVLIAAAIPGFFIAGFWMGVACALAISFVSFLIGLATGQTFVRGRIQGSAGHRSTTVIDRDVIDVQAREKPEKGP